MKMCSVKYATWIFTLLMVINIHAIFAQRGNRPSLQDLITLCNDIGISNCQWLVNDAEDGNGLIPKFSSVHDQSNGYFQSPLARIWKIRSGQLAWNEGDNTGNENLQLGIPFNYDAKRDANSFSSWGGKRARTVRENTSNGKRQTAFSNWGGKRTQKFFNWGGKRNIDTNPVVEQMSERSEHNIMKRNADTSHLNELREKPTCMTNDLSVEELFRDFIDWSRKQPDHKKDSIHRKMFGISVLRGSDNMNRRADSFFQWGGKRSTKNN